jgi:ferrochelatase
MTAKSAVLLLAHGTPGTPADVPAYMKNVTGGRPITDAVMEEVKHRYGLIGRSPLTEITMQQAAALQAALEVPVYVGMRNWHPFISETVKRMHEDGVTAAVAICMAPQNSQTSVGLYKRAMMSGVEAAAAKMDIAFVEEWHDHPLLVRAFAEKLRAVLGEAKAELARVPVLFTAHSVPCRTIASADAEGKQLAGDPYSNQAKETAAAIAQQAGLSADDWEFAFQSQGMSGGPWIGPTVEDTLKGLAAAGHKGVIMQPIGFLCDHVEVLYDIDIAFRELAKQLGMRLWRAESLNDSELFIKALADIARAKLPAQTALASRS